MQALSQSIRCACAWIWALAFEHAITQSSWPQHDLIRQALFRYNIIRFERDLDITGDELFLNRLIMTALAVRAMLLRSMCAFESLRAFEWVLGLEGYAP